MHVTNMIVWIIWQFGQTDSPARSLLLTPRCLTSQYPGQAKESLCYTTHVGRVPEMCSWHLVALLKISWCFWASCFQPLKAFCLQPSQLLWRGMQCSVFASALLAGRAGSNSRHIATGSRRACCTLFSQPCGFTLCQTWGNAIPALGKIGEIKMCSLAKVRWGEEESKCLWSAGRYHWWWWSQSSQRRSSC